MLARLPASLAAQHCGLKPGLKPACGRAKRRMFSARQGQRLGGGGGSGKRPRRHCCGCKLGLGGNPRVHTGYRYVTVAQ